MLRRSARLLLVPVLVSAAVLSAVVSAGPAAAAPPPVIAAYEIRTNESVVHPAREFGSATATGPQIAVGTATTAFDVRFGGPTQDTDCWLTTADGTVLASRSWYGADDDGNDRARLFAVPAGMLADGVRYAVACRDGAFVSSRLTWNVTATSARTSPTEMLEPAAELLVAQTFQTVFFDSRGDSQGVVSRGELVRIVAPAGTWTPPGQRSPTLVELSEGEGTIGEPVRVVALEPSPDGSAVSFVVPADLPPEFARGAFVSVLSSATAAATADRPKTTTQSRWFGTIDIVAKASSRTSVALSASTVLFTKPRATIRVAVDGGVAPVGGVTLYVDGYVVARSALTAGSAGTVVVPMPRISKGTHSVVAVFAGTDVAVGSVSAPKPLRVLR